MYLSYIFPEMPFAHSFSLSFGCLRFSSAYGYCCFYRLKYGADVHIYIYRHEKKSFVNRHIQISANMCTGIQRWFSQFCKLYIWWKIVPVHEFWMCFFAFCSLICFFCSSVRLETNNSYVAQARHIWWVHVQNSNWNLYWGKLPARWAYCLVYEDCESLQWPDHCQCGKLRRILLFEG